MKVLVSALVVGFALLIALVSSSDAIECEKYRRCYSFEPLDVQSKFVKCDDGCAAWDCVYNRKRYDGAGCKGDKNICHIGNNQNGTQWNDTTTPNAFNWFFSCNNDPSCALKLKNAAINDRDYMGLLAKIVDEGYCDVIDKRNPLQCEKQNSCAVNGKPNYDHNPDTVICTECAAWECLYNGIRYRGLGCNGDSNICKHVRKQDISPYHENNKTTWFVACKDTDKCAKFALEEYQKLENYSEKSPQNNETTECSPYVTSVDNLTTTTPVNIETTTLENVETSTLVHNETSTRGSDETSTPVHNETSTRGEDEASTPEHNETSTRGTEEATTCSTAEAKKGPLICEKQKTCAKRTSKSDPSFPDEIDCDECAAWSCILNNTLHTGFGCKGESNICNNGENQNGTESHDEESWFVTCNDADNCASKKLHEYTNNVGKWKKAAFNHDGECNLKALRCEKANNCRTKKGVFGGELSHVECQECAAWSCVKSGVAYTGLGCKGDPNICQTESNQNGTEFHYRTNYFVSCNDHMCAFPTIKDLVLRVGRENPWFADIECDPNLAVTKNGIFTCLALFTLVWFNVLGV